MTATTACVGLPYPEPADPPDIQQYFEDLAVATDAAICGASSLPVGSIVPWYEGPNDPAIPPGYLVCDGSSFNAGTYPALQQHLSSTLTPDFRGRFLRGKDAAGGPFPGAQQTGGYSDSQLPQHSHSQADHRHTISHSHGIATDNDSHAHAPFNVTGAAESFMYRLSSNSSGGSQIILQSGSVGSGIRVEYSTTATASDTHAHGGATNSQSTSWSGFEGATIGNAGGTTTNRNLPPFGNVVFLIRAA